MHNKKFLALLGEDSSRDVLAALFSLGFEICVLPKHARLALPVSSHADMLAFPLDRRVFFPREYIKDKKELKEQLSSYGYKAISCRTHLSECYPDDIAFNFARLGNKILGRTDKMAKKLYKCLSKSGCECVKVKQGYAKCSTVVLGENAVITADLGIAKSAGALGYDVLQIENSQNSVKLNGYDYGFIGGACDVCGKTVYFTGNIDLHPNSTDIKAFCQKHDFDIISLSQEELTDIGGIIFLPDIS